MDKLDRPVLLKEITPDNSWVFLVQLSDLHSAVLLALFMALSCVDPIQEQVLDCFCQIPRQARPSLWQMLYSLVCQGEATGSGHFFG